MICYEEVEMYIDSEAQLYIQIVENMINIKFYIHALIFKSNYTLSDYNLHAKQYSITN